MSKHPKYTSAYCNLMTNGLYNNIQVLFLGLTRPKRFNYQPGDYIFLKVPAIAKYEWHPFTMSSSPEQQDFIGLHIRVMGTWTSKLYDFVEERNRTLKRDMEMAERKLQLQIPGANRDCSKYI